MKLRTGGVDRGRMLAWTSRTNPSPVHVVKTDDRPSWHRYSTSGENQNKGAGPATPQGVPWPLSIAPRIGRRHETCTHGRHGGGGSSTTGVPESKQGARTRKFVPISGCQHSPSPPRPQVKVACRPGKRGRYPLQAKHRNALFPGWQIRSRTSRSSATCSVGEVP